ncbi:hypothetical protein SIAM614_12973 [Stappia aggregata IAM 12614]|uniref:Uncharacterized protein n=1 Tax=Roseibium aggregatum (strain ATCC 25650 / DSM 13394 / JCM 20685 / NBRC 16684 / NCIMB 2208 / IAM 12614 / B1) TaxID=384765 RepID=A0NQ70_ROSAI|nr:hypothetical protein [Roseibium aggregatum]EAV44928.1 hypothetical protein SIAM614_12973 [Stappia aggregata IAM 12614] [Roseibium aggregatum IAM 12614]
MKSMTAEQISQLDPAAVVLWVFHPEGPKDVYEPSHDGEEKIAARMTVLKELGALAAVISHPHLFPEDRRVRSC